MAAKRDALHQWAAKIGRWGWTGLLVLSIGLLCSRWMFPQLPVGIVTATIGGALLLLAFIGCGAVINLGNNSLVNWLGTRSFSLYLVHEPIVLSIVFSLQATNPFQVAGYAVPLSLLAAEIFFRLVEQPSRRLASLAGKAMADRARRQQEVLSVRS